MTLKEELEILRGEPIQVFTGNPMDIPCIETSDPERLCKHPVVSVHMITYNHEPYIRQAIEGVMMQRTDFEYELVIGEDCSTDKTREICFEYQKKYPDKIRVLWCDHNLYRNPHPAGGNGARNMAHCRGEFIALCEGDDYWIDPLKLQKQVDVFRKYPNVGFCFCGSKILKQATGEITVWNERKTGFAPGLISSQKYVLWTMFGKDPLRGWGSEFWQMTATFMVRKATLLRARAAYDIFNWRLSVGDATFCIGCGSLGDVYYIGENMSMYRRSVSGVTLASGGKCAVDTLIVRCFFARKILGLSYSEIPDTFVIAFFDAMLQYKSTANGQQSFSLSCNSVLTNKDVSGIYMRRLFLLQRFWRFDVKRMQKYGMLLFLYRKYISGTCISARLYSLYAKCGAADSLKLINRASFIALLRRRISRIVRRH